MARTAPVRNIPPIPGMCPSVAVLAGDGDGGGGSGKGAGSGDGSAGTERGGESAGGDQRSAAGSSGKPGSGPCCCSLCHSSTSAGDPVDPVTGRVFTEPALDLWLPGSLPFRWTRTYSSALHDRDVGLGYGWSHAFSWELELLRRSARLRPPHPGARPPSLQDRRHAGQRLRSRRLGAGAAPLRR